MSMLAGPKRKQKWTLNPRGKQWSEDSSKFGQKLMEKMGWSAGKGLGANEQGSVEHIRVKVKNDQVGIGFDRNKDNQWTEHQDVFNEFLQNLQKEQSGDVVEAVEDKEIALSGKSLEEKSKQSQKRVHYKKFTRGKDVNKYSTKDLANIFGKKDLNEKATKKEEESVEEIAYDPIGTKDTTAGILTIKGGNMADYFKKKLNGEQNYVSEEKENSDSETEKCVGFGFSEKSKSKFYVNDNDCIDEVESESEVNKYKGFGFIKSSEPKSKTKKHNNLDYVFDNPCLDLNIPSNNSPKPTIIKTEIVNYEVSELVAPRKRKSKFIYENEGLDLQCPDMPTPKKRKSDFAFENECLDLEEIKIEIKKEPMDIEIESCAFEVERPTPKKSKKSKKNKDLNLDEIKEEIKEEPIDNEIENCAFEVERPTPKKSKKSKKKEVVSNGIENPGLNLNFPDTPVLRKDTKFKSQENLSNGIENPALDLNCTDTPVSIKVMSSNNEHEVVTNGIENPALNLECSDRVTPKKNKKSKKNEVIGNGVENPGLDLDFPDTPTPIKVKKSKINDSLPSGIENPGLDLQFPDTPTPKKLKKIKSNEVLTSGFENLGLNIDFPDTPTPKKLKKSKSNEVLLNGFENPGLDLDFPDTPTPKKVKKCINENEVTTIRFENPGLDLESSNSEVRGRVEFEVARPSSGLENVALDLSDENSSKKRVTFNDHIEYNTDVVKKKKKKKNKLDKYEVVTDKLKKKNKVIEPIAFVNEALDANIMNEEEKDNQANERKSKKGRRRKERRISTLETIVEAPEEALSESLRIIPEDNENIEIVSKINSEILSDQEVQEIPNVTKETLKKKNKRKKDARIELEVVQEVVISEEPVEKTEKKKKKNLDVESQAKIEVNSKVDEKENVCDEQDKKLKKKKKISEDDVVSLEEFLNEDPPTVKNENVNTNDYVSEIEAREEKRKYFENERKTKQIMKSLFIKNPTLVFNGSNINEISGYGSKLQNQY